MINVLLVCVNFNNDLEFSYIVEEGEELVKSTTYNYVDTVIVKRNLIDRKYFIGSGKVQELKILCKYKKINLAVFNHNLTPLQERNLSNALEVDIRDRAGLILDIFSLRAKTNEAVMQVELAKQQYLLPRLVGRWTHLERQRGGIATVGGSGEKQLELDKRLIKTKIQQLKQRLALIVKQRNIQRQSRNKKKLITIAIVGYTNAGKSTLFNILTKNNVFTKDQLFATLNTTTRKAFIANGYDIIISDTVGFIRNLSHNLIAAFRATLEETIHADLLLNVVDVSQPLKDRQIDDVNKVLKEINAHNIPSIIVYNKIDCIDNLPKVIYINDVEPLSVYISAKELLGLDLLKNAIIQKINSIQLLNSTSSLEYLYE